MGITVESYRDALLNLLPRGRAWARDITSTMAALMFAIADELFRVHGRAADLLQETDPRTTTEMIDAWERVLGLPDECSNTVSPTIDERRAAVVGRYLGVGGHNIPYLVSVASRMGFAITIVDKVTPHHYEIKVPGVTVTTLKAGAGPGHRAGYPLRIYGTEIALECVIVRLNQAHAIPTFTYNAAQDYSYTYNYEVQRYA